MIMQQTRLKVADNCGAKEILCIRAMGGSRRRYARLGDTIIASVKEAIPKSDVKKGQVVRAVVVRTRKEFKRKDGSTIRFDTNAAVLIDAQDNPVGNRIFGPIPMELRAKEFARICSLAPEIV